MPSQTLTMVLKVDSTVKSPSALWTAAAEPTFLGLGPDGETGRVSRYGSGGAGATQRRSQNCSGGREAQYAEIRLTTERCHQEKTTSFLLYTGGGREAAKWTHPRLGLVIRLSFMDMLWVYSMSAVRMHS